MKILFVCHRFPFPPNQGGTIRSFNILRHFHQQGHEVYVASLTRSKTETEAIHGISGSCFEYHFAQIVEWRAWARMLFLMPISTPSSMIYFHSRELGDRISQLLAKKSFDLIFVHCSSAAQYVSDVTGVPKILDFGDMDSEKWKNYAQTRAFPITMGYWWEARKLEREEKRFAARFDLSTCTTKAELEILQKFGTASSTGWFPNGVDFDYFSPGSDPYDPELLCFIGRMDYYPNQLAMVDFCRDVLPLVQSYRPNVRLQIVGADPSRAVRKLAELKGVTVTGSVEDVRPYVSKSALTVAPLKIARGTQNKILESMAMGVPVIASTTASRGVDVIPGEHLLTADSPRDVADAVLGLLDDTDERERLSAVGRARMLSHHDWSISMQRLDELIGRYT